MSKEEAKGKRGLPPGGSWVYVGDQRRHALPVVVDGETRWKLKDGTDVTDLVGVAHPRPARTTAGRVPEVQAHIKVDQPLKVIIVTEEEGLNCLENLFYLSDTMKQIAEELTKIRQIFENLPEVKENLRVAKELEKMKAMGERGG